ncbi:MAG: ATP synthase F1 subunit gamma [Bdellovibrionales bacterium]|nr:ATP synthase F1 subunit gamma [Bdellovibrionales bacterium]
MASARDLRRRIGSVKNTQQITKAMKMVAAARLRRAQDAIVRARPYAAAIKGMVANISGIQGVEELHPLLRAREVKRAVVVLITSDRGLCGGFNSNLIKRAEALYRAEKDKVSFVTIGKRGYDYLRGRQIPVQKNYTDFFKSVSYAKVQAVSDELIEGFLSGEYDEVRVVFSEFRSAISQIPQTVSLLPIRFPQEAGKSSTEFLFEPDKRSVLADILPRYFRAKIYKAVLESQASEFGARMAAMDSATKNAGEMIRKLSLEYNKQRQAGITKELLEIVSGAEALK